MTDYHPMLPGIIANRVGFAMMYSEQYGYRIDQWLAGAYQVDIELVRKTLYNLWKQRKYKKIIHRSFYISPITRKKVYIYYCNYIPLFLELVINPPGTNYKKLSVVEKVLRQEIGATQYESFEFKF